MAVEISEMYSKVKKFRLLLSFLYPRINPLFHIRCPVLMFMTEAHKSNMKQHVNDVNPYVITTTTTI